MAHVAHKLGVGSVLGACVLLAGCQNTSGSRFASNQGPAQPMMAKQKQAPQPSWPTSPRTASGTGSGTTTATTPKAPGLNTSTASGAPNSINTNAFPAAPATVNTAGASNTLTPLPTQGSAPVATPSAPLSGAPAPLGPTTSTNRSNVTVTAPLAEPSFPPAPGGLSTPPPPPLSQPGLLPLEQP